MKPRTAFWDSSALITLLYPQSSSTRARQLVRTFSRQVIWWATPVEIVSALSRLHREELVTSEQLQKHLSRLTNLQKCWIEVSPVEQVRMTAQSLLLQHPLRAADSLQLAAALAWCKQKPKRRPFICFDKQLAQVAEAVGFEVHRFD